MSPLAPLRSLRELAMPDTWASIPLVNVRPGWAAEVAGELCEGEKAQVRLAGWLEQAHPKLTARPHLMVGVWVPDPAIPEPAGIMTVDWLVPDEGQERADRDYYRSLIEPDRRPRITVFARQIEDVELPAGPALFVHEVSSGPAGRWSPWRETVEEHVMYTVFPHGCTDAVELSFITSSLDLGDLLAADAAIAADTLRVNLAEGAEP